MSLWTLLSKIFLAESSYNRGWNNLNKRLAGAVCVPASCSSEFVETLADYIFNGTGLIMAKDYNQNKYCQTAETGLNSTIDYIVR